MEADEVLARNRKLQRTAETLNSKIVDFGPMEEDPVYKPATKNAALSRIQLSELEVGRCHVGRVLGGVLRGKAFKLGNLVVSAIQDEAGKVASLMLRYGIEWKTPANEVAARYPDGTQVLIREPCFVEKAYGTTVWVVNPAAFEVVTFFKNLTIKEADKLKDFGQVLLKTKNLLGAVEIFSRCIKHSSDSVVTGFGFSGRAEALLKLGNFCQAIRDAAKSIAVAGCGRSYLTRAQALVSLRQYTAAAESMKHALLDDYKAEKGIENELRSYYEMCKRLDEQSRLGNMSIALDSREVFPDYVGPVEVKMSKDKGRGVFLTRDVKAGCLLMVNNRVVSGLSATDEGGAASVDDFVSRGISACLACPVILAKLYSLWSPEVVPGMELFRSNEHLDEDKLLQQQQQQEFDARDMERLMRRGENKGGIFTLPRFINHSCLPNVTIAGLEDVVYVLATRDIEAGTELVVSYQGCVSPWRPSRIRQGCGPDAFSCKCARCELEEKLDGELKHICSKFEAECKSARPSLAPVALSVEKKLGELKLQDSEKQWIRCSFALAYFSWYQRNRSNKAGMPSLVDFLEGLIATVPGQLEPLLMMLERIHPAVRRSPQVRGIFERACVLTFGAASTSYIGKLCEKDY